MEDRAHQCIPHGVAAALTRGGWLELPTLRNLAVCSRGILAEGDERTPFFYCNVHCNRACASLSQAASTP